MLHPAVQSANLRLSARPRAHRARRRGHSMPGRHNRAERPSSVTVVDDTTVMCNSTTSYPDTQTLDVAVSIDAGAHWTRLMPGSNVGQSRASASFAAADAALAFAAATVAAAITATAVAVAITATAVAVAEPPNSSPRPSPPPAPPPPSPPPSPPPAPPSPPPPSPPPPEPPPPPGPPGPPPSPSMPPPSPPPMPSNCAIPFTQISLHDYRPSWDTYMDAFNAGTLTANTEAGDPIPMVVPPGPMKALSSETCQYAAHQSCWAPDLRIMPSVQTSAPSRGRNTWMLCSGRNPEDESEWVDPIWAIFDMGRPMSMESVTISLAWAAHYTPAHIDACDEVMPANRCSEVRQIGNSETFINDHCAQYTRAGNQGSIMVVTSAGVSGGATPTFSTSRTTLIETTLQTARSSDPSLPQRCVRLFMIIGRRCQREAAEGRRTPHPTRFRAR